MASTSLRLRLTALALLAVVCLTAAFWAQTRASGAGPAGLADDLTGTWNLHLTGPISIDCTVEFVQTGTDLAGTWVCPDYGDGTFQGTITLDEAGNEFDIAGDIGGVDITAEGRVASDGLSSTGTWEALGFNGTFSATRKLDETATPTPTATLPATPGEEATSTPPVVSPSPPTNTPAVTATPPGGETPAPLSGDASCDGNVNSIDAALALQYGAGIVGSLPCFDAADVNGDGVVNSVDAALMLQYIAGLLDHLPV